MSLNSQHMIMFGKCQDPVCPCLLLELPEVQAFQNVLFRYSGQGFIPVSSKYEYDHLSSTSNASENPRVLKSPLLISVRSRAILESNVSQSAFVPAVM